MEVEATVWYWTAGGMCNIPSSGGSITGYIEKREVERLLEMAHKRGWEGAVAAEAERRRGG